MSLIGHHQASLFDWAAPPARAKPVATPPVRLLAVPKDDPVATPAVRYSGRVVALSDRRHRASAEERRRYGGATVTDFIVYRVEDRGDPTKWKHVRAYGPTPGDRKTDAIRRSGL